MPWGEEVGGGEKRLEGGAGLAAATWRRVSLERAAETELKWEVEFEFESVDDPLKITAWSNVLDLAVAVVDPFPLRMSVGLDADPSPFVTCPLFLGEAALAVVAVTGRVLLDRVAGIRLS